MTCVEHIQVVSPNTGQNCPAKTKHRIVERFIPYQSLSRGPFNKINSGLENWVTNLFRIINFLITGNRRIVAIRKFLAISENRQINSLYENARCVFSIFRRPEKTRNLGAFPRIRFLNNPVFASTDLRRVAERVNKWLPLEWVRGACRSSHALPRSILGRKIIGGAAHQKYRS